MTTLNLLVLLLSVLGSARAETFIGYGTIVHDSVSQWGGALRSFGCQFNTTSAYFAENFASMNRPQWDGSAACGRCIKVWCTDARCTEQNASKVLQIVDQCGHCQEGDIGMSASAFKSVTGTRQQNLKVSWEWAECAPYMDQPNILFTPKTDGVSAYWQALNFANLARPLKSVAANGNNLPRTSWNNWVWTPQSGALDLNAPLALTLTSDSGETVSTTVNQLEQQWLDIQFSASIPDIAQPTTPPSPSVEPPPSPSVEPSPSPSVEPSPSPSVEPSPSPVVEPSPSPIVDPSPSPSVEPSPSPVVEPSPSPIVEPSPSPSVEPSPSPSVEPSPSPSVEPSPSPIVEPSPSPIVEPSPSPSVEPSPSPSVEPSPSPIVEPSPSPSMDPSPSPPVQPSPSPSSSPSSPPPSTGGGQLPAITAEYGKVLGLSWWFYEAQRSGKLPPTNRVPWRGDSHLNDKVPGGWYDAGDHLKLNFPLATTATFLSWGVIEFGDAYSRAGELQHAQEGIRWVADYLMACHYDTSSYIGQIGDPGPDHAYWGRPEEQTGPRPFYVWDASKPGSDLIGAAASALASASIVFKASDPEYAQACLFHATQLYTLASQHEGKYSDSIPSVTYVYMSANYLDDLAFAAAWLYRATGDAQYLDASQKYLKRAQYQRNYFVNWDSVFSATDNLLLSMGVKGSEPVNGDIEWHFTEFLKAWQQGKHGMKFSPKGLAVAPLGGWGNLRHSSNAAFMMVLHAKYTSDQGVRSACLEFAKGQIDYMLGSTGRSYVVGYGNNPPTSPHHRAASCPDRPDVCNYDTAFKNPGPNPQILYGALVGGPNDQDVYEDKRSDYVSNEVAVDYNAGFTGTLAGLVQLLQ